MVTGQFVSTCMKRDCSGTGILFYESFSRHALIAYGYQFAETEGFNPLHENVLSLANFCCYQSLWNLMTKLSDIFDSLHGYKYAMVGLKCYCYFQ